MLKIKQKYVIVIVEQIEGCGEEGGMAMKLEKINDNQILWSLYKEDLIQNQISLSDFVTGTPKVKEMFREAIRLAEQDLSFQVDGYILNCRLKELDEEKITFSITKKEYIPETPYLIGEFGSLDEVLDASRLLAREIGLKNELYKFEGSYFLIMQPERKDDKQLTWCTVKLSEFTNVEAVSPNQRAFIQEHGECIVRDNALQKLAGMMYV